MPAATWTVGQIEILKKGVRAGMSASALAAEIGDGITRNAVVSKIHRMNLGDLRPLSLAPKPGPKPKPFSEPMRRPKPTPPRSAPATHRRLRLNDLNDPVTLDTCPVEQSAPAALRLAPASGIDIMALTQTSCRWPVEPPPGEPMRYCGAEKTFGGKPYCARHAAAAVGSRLAVLEAEDA